MTDRNFIAYDFAYVYGGAERVMADLCRAFETSQLYVSFSEPDIRAQYKEQGINLCDIKSSPLSWLPFSHAVHAISGFSRLQLKGEFKHALVSGFYAPLCLPYLRATQRFYYCHTPPRFLFDLRDFYQRKLGMISPVLNVLEALYLPRYQRSLEHADVILANSKNVQQRLNRYLGVESHVVYPGIEIGQYQSKESQGFFLSLARHESYKRLELIIDAFKTMPDVDLVVASGGSMSDQLRAQASGHDNIRFTGWTSSTQLKRLLSECRAAIYLPKDEDFGISPIEAMASGKPVIGVEEGGVKETVIHGQTGLLCPQEPTVEDIKEAVQRMSQSRADGQKAACIERARQFDISAFNKKIRSLMM